MDQLSKYSDLLLTVYEGATDATAWPRILSSVAHWMDVERTLLVTPWLMPSKGGFAFAHGITQQQIELWQTGARPEDLRARRLEERGLVRNGEVVLGHELVSHEDLLASRWWREFLSRLDLFHNLTGVIFDRRGADLPATVLNCYRGQAEQPFDEQHRRRLKALVPHLARSLGVMFRLRTAEMHAAASLAALDRLSSGVLLFDSRCRVLFANTVARQVLREQDGLRLRSLPQAEGMLEIDDPVSALQLARALQVVAGSMRRSLRQVAHDIRIHRPSGRPRLTLQLSCLAESNPYAVSSHPPCAIGFLMEEAPGRVDETLLGEAYGLTPAERRAALALCHGGAIDEVSVSLDISPNTLKTHLKSIYAKTSVNSRAGLTRLLLSMDGR